MRRSLVTDAPTTATPLPPRRHAHTNVLDTEAATTYSGVMPDFELFTDRSALPTKEPAVTFGKRGTLSINKAAHAAVGSPEAVELLFDRSAQIVGIRAADPKSPHAYRLRANAANGPFIATATAFCRHYGIKTGVARRWPATLDDGVLCLDLSTEGVEIKSNRNGRPKRDDAEAVSG